MFSHISFTLTASRVFRTYRAGVNNQPYGRTYIEWCPYPQRLIQDANSEFLRTTLWKQETWEYYIMKYNIMVKKYLYTAVFISGLRTKGEEIQIRLLPVTVNEILCFGKLLAGRLVVTSLPAITCKIRVWAPRWLILPEKMTSSCITTGSHFDQLWRYIIGYSMFRI